MATIQSTLEFQDKMSNVIKKIGENLDRATVSTEKARQEMEDMTNAYGVGSKEAMEATKIWAREKQEMDSLNKTLEQAKRDQEELARAERQAALEAAFQNQNTNILQKGFEGLKSIVSGVAGKIAAGMKIVDMAVNAVISTFNNMKQAVSQSIDDFSKYQSTMVDVTNLLSEAEKSQYADSLENASKAAIRNGISIEQANTSLFNAVSALGDVNKALSVYENAQKLAKAGATSLETATSGLNNVINAYGLEAEEASDVSAAFFRAQKVGVTNVGELASAIGGIAPVAKSAGVGYKELLATMAVLTKGGLDTASSATALRAAMTALIKPSKQAEEVLRQYGVPVGAAELQSKGLAYALERLQAAAEQNPDTMAEMIPNIRALTGVSTLSADSLKLVQQTINDMDDDIKNGTGYLEAYNAKMETLESTTNRFKGAGQDLSLTIGEMLEPIIKAFLGTLTEVINFINNAITIVMEFSDILKVILGGALTFLIGRFIFLNLTMQMVTNTAKIMWAAISGPIGIVIGLATIVVAIFNKLFGLTFKDNVRNALASLYAIAGVCRNLITLFENAGTAFTNIFKKEGEKKKLKDFQDVSIYSNYDRADKLMGKLGVGKMPKMPTVPVIKTGASGLAGGGGLGGGNGLAGLTTNTSGGKALKTQNQGKIEMQEDDIELLHDLATRDFMLNYQQLTPQITIPGMVIHETADVDSIFEAFADNVTEVVNSSMQLVDGRAA